VFTAAQGVPFCNQLAKAMAGRFQETLNGQYLERFAL